MLRAAPNIVSTSSFAAHPGVEWARGYGPISVFGSRARSKPRWETSWILILAVHVTNEEPYRTSLPGRSSRADVGLLSNREAWSLQLSPHVIHLHPSIREAANSAAVSIEVQERHKYLLNSPLN